MRIARGSLLLCIIVNHSQMQHNQSTLSREGGWSLFLYVGCGIHSSLINTRWAERSSLPSPSIYITEVVSEKKHNSVKSFNWDVLVPARRSFLPNEYVLVDALVKAMRDYQAGLGPHGRQKMERCHHSPRKKPIILYFFRPPGPRDRQLLVDRSSLRGVLLAFCLRRLRHALHSTNVSIFVSAMRFVLLFARLAKICN